MKNKIAALYSGKSVTFMVNGKTLHITTEKASQSKEIYLMAEKAKK